LVITAAELEDRIAQRQAYILGQLAEVLVIQREARSQTMALSIRLDETGRLDREDVHLLQKAIRKQWLVDLELIGDGNGLQTNIEALLTNLENNRVDSPDIQRPMKSLLVQIELLGNEHLPVIHQELVSTREAAAAQLKGGAKAFESKNVGRSLREARRRQDQVIAGLRRMQHQADFVELVRRQQDLAQLASPKDRDGEHKPLPKARMRDLEAEQRRIREDLNELLADIENHAAQLPDEEQFNRLRETATEFVEALRDSGAAEAMADAEAALAEFNGTRGYEKAKEAADILAKFLSQCEDMGNCA